MTQQRGPWRRTRARQDTGAMNILSKGHRARALAPRRAMGILESRAARVSLVSEGSSFTDAGHNSCGDYDREMQTGPGCLHNAAVVIPTMDIRNHVEANTRRNPLRLSIAKLTAIRTRRMVGLVGSSFVSYFFGFRCRHGRNCRQVQRRNSCKIAGWLLRGRG